MGARVVVVGAGYAGVNAAKRLSRSDSRVTVVNPRADFVERIRLHQLLAGNHQATRPLTGLLPRSAEFVQDAAESIDANAQQVKLAGGRTLDYDYLIYTVGSRSSADLVPGATEHAVTAGVLEEAVEARRRFDSLPEGATVTVVGGGLTGVELAAELAELGRHHIRLISDEAVAPSVSEQGRAYIRRHFGTLGIELIERTAVTGIGASTVGLADGRELGSDLTVLTARFEVPSLAKDSGLLVDEDGTLRVQRNLVSTGDPHIIGAGDASRIEADPLRMSCQAAIPLGAHAAETVLRLAGGREPRPVRPKFAGQCISLGRGAALWQRTDSHDNPSAMTVRGKPGALVKEQICSSSLAVALNPKLGLLSYSWSW